MAEPVKSLHPSSPSFFSISFLHPSSLFLPSILLLPHIFSISFILFAHLSFFYFLSILSSLFFSLRFSNFLYISHIFKAPLYLNLQCQQFLLESFYFAKEFLFCDGESSTHALFRCDDEELVLVSETII
ncbi:hypothetical protein MANES_14G163828v8 [Manihot esculenta]|uniref:Uncharacterized protein n=1 Tax=Manihot esculenta TaxID=3983 RepID=A0ACB7GI19_MANES|nr:hypothetical protein MANES_14G163828v8 [Manihot esculenta]